MKLITPTFLPGLGNLVLRLAAVFALRAHIAQAAPYASGNFTNGDGNVYFFMNEGGGVVTVKYEDSTTYDMGEPAGGDDATRSFRTKTLQRVENSQTIADGASTQSLGRLTFPLVLANVHDFLTVTDGELVEAMRFLWERMKLVVEPTGALATAGVLQGRRDTRGARVGIILSGGNVDLRAAAALFA